MVLNPLNELKRRLEDTATPLPKRLCLAKNVVRTNHFPLGPKERVIGDWLDTVTKNNELNTEGIRDILTWVSISDCVTAELKSTLIEIIANYVEVNKLEAEDIQSILLFLTNDSIVKQLHNHIKQFLVISKTLLQKTKGIDTNNSIKILNNYVEYYKQSKQKLQFIIDFIDRENLEVLFECMDSEELKEAALNVCQNILFPITKKSFYSLYLQKLIRQDNVEKLIQEKGDNIQSVVKILDCFFNFPEGRSNDNYVFIQKFISTFVFCYKTEHQLIFAFYIICVNCLNLKQHYIIPTSKISIIKLENGGKVERKIFLNMLEALLCNDVNINVRLTDTMGEKASKIETKKTFMMLLQFVIISFLKVKGKVDKISLKVLTTALRIDPVLIEKIIDKVLPPIMVSKKNNESISIAYEEMLICLLEILFKLSRGTLFINQILPFLKLELESVDEEQKNLKKELENGDANEKIVSKILNAEDVIPLKCIEKYGYLTTELMFRQNVELLISLQNDFELYCMKAFDDDSVAPSVIILTEIMSAIFCNFFQHCKMSEHTVPKHISEEFWNVFEKFEFDILKKFGCKLLECNFGAKVTQSFLKLCHGYAQLKILNLQYCNYKINHNSSSNIENIYDLSMVLPCLTSQQWNDVRKLNSDPDATAVFDNLLLLNIIYSKLLLNNEAKIEEIKSYLIKEISNNIDIIQNNTYFSKVLLSNITHTQVKQFTKAIFNICMEEPELNLLEIEAIQNHKEVLTGLVLETLKSLLKIINKDMLAKAITNRNFDISVYCKELNIGEYFEITEKEYDSDEINKINNCIKFLKQLKVYNLEENCILSTIFVLVSIKNVIDKKKVRKNIDTLLQTIFELSIKNPDIYKLFSVDYVFTFSDNNFFDLVTLTNKTSNRLFIIEMILELTVKKVKTESEIIREAVKILLSNQKFKKESSIEYFSNKVFQISCLLLPLVAKEKKAITTSAYRTILAELQENMHESLLKCFKNIDFNEAGNTDEYTVTENNMATLNAMDAFNLTLAKYCENNNVNELKQIDCLWSGLTFFIEHAISSLKNTELASNKIRASIQLVNTILRYIKKLETHKFFSNKEEIYLQIWQCIKTRLVVLLGESNDENYDDVSVGLRFLYELSSVESFCDHFIRDLFELVVFKEPKVIDKQLIIQHRVARLCLQQMLKSNIIGPKCVSISKFTLRFCKNISTYLRLYYEGSVNGDTCAELNEDLCELLATDLYLICEVVLAPKRISLNYKLVDSIFDLEHSLLNLLSLEPEWALFFKLFDTCLYVLNSLLLARTELIEDRWPCFMYSYRTSISYLCKRSSRQVELERDVEEKLSEISHTIEKLTQSMCKHKSQLSRLSTYAIGDICYLLEATAPTRLIRQHLENCVSLLIQISDNSYSVAFLRRALAGNPGHSTLTNLYTMYKRYHKYVGNS